MASAEISRVYLDYNATAPMRPEAGAATLEALEVLGNPSSIHAEGRRARAIVEEARRAVAALAGVEPRGVVFVSGGTEAANLALTPAIHAPERKVPLTRLIVSAGEHPCVLRGHRFASEATAIAPLKADGRLDLDALAEPQLFRETGMRRESLHQGFDMRSFDLNVHRRVRLSSG